jgi:hypothetical protein
MEALISLFADKTGCGIQHSGCPCNTCFHHIGNEVDFRHICWLIVLGLRGDYDTSELMPLIEKELFGGKQDEILQKM